MPRLLRVAEPSVLLGCLLGLGEEPLDERPIILMGPDVPYVVIISYVVHYLTTAPFCVLVPG